MTQVDLSTVLYYLFYATGPVLAVGAWLIGLVLHGLGRSTTLALAVVVFAIGLVMGSALSAALGFLQRQPSIGTVVGSMWFLAVPLIGVIALAMTGRRRAAGLLMTGVAVPWTAVWGWFLVEDLLGRDGATLLIVAMFLAGLGPLLIGIALIAAGDPVPVPDPGAPMGRPGSRRPGSMGHRLIAEATYGAVGPAFVLAFVAATTVGIVLPGQLVLQLVVAVAAAAIGTEIELRWIPPRVRPAVEGFHWVGLGELARFRAGTGETVPTSPKAFQTWLARHPESDATRPWRIEMLNFLGEHAEARAEIQRWSPPARSNASIGRRWRQRPAGRRAVRRTCPRSHRWPPRPVRRDRRNGSPPTGSSPGGRAGRRWRRWTPTGNTRSRRSGRAWEPPRTGSMPRRCDGAPSSCR